MAKKKMTLEEKMEEAVVTDVPYEVPRNWVWVKLGNGVTIKRGASPRPIKSFITEENDGVSWIKIGDTNNGKYVTSTKQKITNKGVKKSVYLEKDTLILSNSMSFGKPYILKISGCIHDGWLAFSNYEKIFTQDFLYYTFLNSEWYFDKVATGSAVRNLNRDRVSNLPCVVPPLKEQQRIVDRIESLFEKLDKAKGLIEEARVGFEKRKSAILEKAFRGELTENWRVKKRAIKEYKTYILKDLLKPMTTRKPNVSEEYFRYIDIDSIDNKNQIVGEPKIVETVKAPSRASKEVIKGDILFSTVRPYLKNIAYITEDLEDCIASTGFYICRCKEILDSRFLYMMLCSDKVLNYYTSLMKGDNSPSIRKGEFEGLKINLPSVEEQKEIVRILDKLLEDESKIEELTALENQIELIKKSTLAKAFRGELGTNDSNEESALELLKEILSKE
ncbi:restriction endonuclease subunit S [Clostridium botulinum]|uniref:Restriction endonuclease n=2 Tax=Clostridium botulinum TaxID=1491 RepID=A0A0L9YAG9_CLOBO|nr:restriction endonuclease subunit S [Clostridium botulinum]KAI3349488.1 restriction endonuclease subunit S [Clostridium botulinum]KOM88608.1 hypothetical protein ACP51_05085 [Clostridium botulinum]KOR57445.1 hypothetical protein ADT22_11775 [Clostridium botulinum]MBN1048891.1 restriction endonuclease [Clostridium botulinum]NFE83519.1 restriction endonuclease [Clostridium botulinum]